MLTVFLTAVVGGLVVLAGDRVRWRREDRVRWMADRKEAYTSYLASIDRWEMLDHEAAMSGENEEWFEAPAEDRLDPLLGTQTSSRIRPRANAASASASDRLSGLHLFASRTVLASALALHAEMLTLSGVRYDSPPRSCGGSSDDLNAAWERYAHCRDEFVETVRLELGADG